MDEMLSRGKTLKNLFGNFDVQAYGSDVRE